MSRTSKISSTVSRLRSLYLGKIPKLHIAHSNVQFKKLGRRSNWAAAHAMLNLKSGACAKTLFFCLFARTVHANRELFDDVEQTTIHWSERFVEDGESCLIAEHGWLPRISYQISPQGANARSHVCFDSRQDYLAQLGGAPFAQCKQRARHFIRPRKVDYPTLTDQPFCLIPLQGGDDYNLKFSDSGFDHIFGQKGASDKVAAALMDRCHVEAKGMRLIVTEHPAKACRMSQPPKCPDGVVFVGGSEGVRSIDLAAHENCHGVVSINSNLIHEAMILGKPICSYGNLMYRKNDRPTYSSINKMLEAGGTDEEYKKCIDQYLAMLFLHQWEVTDLMDPIMLRSLLLEPEAVTPWELRNLLV